MILDAQGVIIDANAAWKAFCVDNQGDAQSCYIGSNYLDICGSADGSSSAEASVVARGLKDLLENGGSFRCEYPCHSPTVERWFELTAATGGVAGELIAVVTHRDITTRFVEQQAARQAHFQSEMLATLVANSNDAILSYDMDGMVVSWNHAAQRLYGYSAKEAIGQSLEILYPTAWPIPLTDYRDRIISGELKSFEAIRVAKDGSRIDVWVTCSPVRGIDGAIEAIANIHRDISERKRLEEARSLIAQEATHRAKNMLSVVNAIQRQTARSASDIEDFTEKFGMRISSLVSSTDLLVAGEWTQVPLADLLETQFDLFDSLAPGQLASAGPAVELRSQAAQALGMALHELLTNSHKHGALSSPAGSVDVSWHIQSGPADGSLQVAWRENGVSFSAEPRRKGFGHTVLTKLARSMIDGELDLKFSEDGLLWTMTIPAQHFVQ